MRFDSLMLLCVVLCLVDGTFSIAIDSDDALSRAQPPFDVIDHDLVSTFASYREGKRLLMLRASRAWRGEHIR